MAQGKNEKGEGPYCKSLFTSKSEIFASVKLNSLNIVCLKMTIRSFLTDEVTRGALDHDFSDTKVSSKPKGVIKTALWMKNENCGFRGCVLNGALFLLGDVGKEG